MINKDNYESYLFLYQEGELNDAERKEVERFLQEHPDIREEMETYYDPSLVVTAVPPANKKRSTIPLWRWSAAACIVLAIGFVYFLSRPLSTISENMVAETKTIIPPTTTEPTIDIPQPTIEQPKYTARQIRMRRPKQNNIITQPAQVQPAVTLNDDIEEPVSNSLPVESTIQNQPIIVATNQLAEVNEIIIVDDLARVIPNSKPESTPPVLNLALRITRNIEEKRQDFAIFIYNMFHPERDNQEMAEAYYAE
ncbi:MAG: hypothetical protein IJK84_04715 [Bacteroidales bacterium]|nr:hypothetical protein [Bacteroidales bacterium]